jgi:O-antigen/teichoic acid export membrane protein
MASAIILLPFYVSYLSASDFGILSIYLAFSLLIQVVTTYSYDSSLYIHFHEYKSDVLKLKSFISSSFLFMIIIGSVVSMVTALVGDFIFVAIFKEQRILFYPYGMLSAITGIFQAIFKVYTNLLQSREKITTYFWSNILLFSIMALSIILGMKLYPNSIIGPVAGRLVAVVIAGGWALITIFKEFGIHFNFPLLRSSFSFNLYTFLYQLLQWVINYFDRFLMALYLAFSSIGIYDFAVKCILILEFILNGLHNSFYPKVVSTVTNQSEKKFTPEINRYYHGFISTIMLLICFCILLLPIAIEFLVKKPAYQESIKYVPYLALVYIFRAIRLYFAIPYGILKYTKPLPIIYTIVSALKILIMILLLKRFSVYGAIAASLLSGVVEIILLILSMDNRFHVRFNKWKVLIAPLLLLITILLFEPMFGSKYPLVLHTFYILVCVGILWWVYRNDIDQFLPLKFAQR